eukprot:GHVU01187695.1.p1 GENE.GHVU01187695.1~~GHVU01187695.1.p1  ORF type:complete len:362 (+),score=41.75 GHVU01187695.1:99-1184(+)
MFWLRRNCKDERGSLMVPLGVGRSSFVRATNMLLLALVLSAAPGSESLRDNSEHRHPDAISPSLAFNAYLKLLRRQAAGALTSESDVLRELRDENGREERQPLSSAFQASSFLDMGVDLDDAETSRRARDEENEKQEQRKEEVAEGEEDLPPVDNDSSSVIGGATGAYKAGHVKGISTCQDLGKKADCANAPGCMWVDTMRRCFKNCQAIEDPKACDVHPECYYSRTAPENECTNDCFQGSPTDRYRLMGCHWCSNRDSCEMFGGACTWFDTEETMTPSCINEGLAETITDRLLTRVEAIVARETAKQGTHEDAVRDGWFSHYFLLIVATRIRKSSPPCHHRIRVADTSSATRCAFVREDL